MISALLFIAIIILVLMNACLYAMNKQTQHEIKQVKSLYDRYAIDALQSAVRKQRHQLIQLTAEFNEYRHGGNP